MEKFVQFRAQRTLDLYREKEKENLFFEAIKIKHKNKNRNDELSR